MKTVAAGAHYTTITVDTAEVVKFSFPSTSLSVEASGGDITVALRDSAQAGDDETITVPDGESRMFIHHRMGVDTYYLTGSGTATLYASNMGDVNPFKAGKRGGDGGGDNTHYKGTTTTPISNGSTTNPITIDGESYTAVFGDVVVYGYTEFVFDGTAWSEFGRPFDTVPTQGSTNAVTSDGVYRNTAGRKYYNGSLLRGETFNSTSNKASGVYSHAEGYGTTASGNYSHAEGYEVVSSGHYSHAEAHYAKASGEDSHAEGDWTIASGKNSHAEGSYTTASGKDSHAGGWRTIANKDASTAIGRWNKSDTDVSHLLIVGNGSENARSNILEVSDADMNVNGDIKINNVAIPTPYTTMPTITEGMLGKIAMYVGATGGGFTQGCFYVASTDGATEPTYSWAQIGSSYRETVLYDLTDTSIAPQMSVVLSDSIANYDDLYIIYSMSSSASYSSNFATKEIKIIKIKQWLSVVQKVGKKVVFNVWSATNVQRWDELTSDTTITRSNMDGYVWIERVVGIKY